MEDSFKILILYEGLIPNSSISPSGYLNIFDVYKFSLTSKFIRNLIEIFSKNKLLTINSKYKSYFEQLIFSETKFPIYFLKYINPKFILEKPTTFVPLNKTDFKAILYPLEYWIYPRIEYFNGELLLFCEEFCTTNGKKVIELTFANLEEASKFAASMGFYSINIEALCENIVEETGIYNLILDDGWKSGLKDGIRYGFYLLDGNLRNYHDRFNKDLSLIKLKNGKPTFVPTSEQSNLMIKEYELYSKFIRISRNSLIFTDDNQRKYVEQFCKIFDLPNTKESHEKIFQQQCLKFDGIYTKFEF